MLGGVEEVGVGEELSNVCFGVVGLYVKDYIVVWEGVVVVMKLVVYFSDLVVFGVLIKSLLLFKCVLFELCKNMIFIGGV